MLPIGPGDLVGAAVNSLAGWSFDAFYGWLAKALALLIEWVWSVLDEASTPHVTAPWFATGLVARLAPLSLAVIVAMMLANAISAGFGGRPELVTDTIREAVAAVFSTAVALTVIDALLQVSHEAAGYVWQLGRADLRVALERWLKVASEPTLGQTFIGPLCVILGIIGLLVTTIVLLMRSTMIYVVAALYPLVRAGSIMPMFRGSARKISHMLVGLIFAPLVITITLVVAVKAFGSNPAESGASGTAAIGTMMSGFLAFLVAGLSPWALYKVMPLVEGAAGAGGIASGWGRSAMTASSAALSAKSLGASKAASAATRAVKSTPSTVGSSGGGDGGTSGGGTSNGPTASSRSPGSSGSRPTSGQNQSAGTPSVAPPADSSAGGSGGVRRVDIAGATSGGGRPASLWDEEADREGGAA
jgi:hypothetical protein